MSKVEDELYGICPFVTTQKILQGKWAILILYHVSKGPVRFNELLRRLPKMTHATLAAQLKNLEAQGLITRKEYPQIPPKVEYSLSEIGSHFCKVLDCIEVWGLEYIELLKQQKQ